MKNSLIATVKLSKKKIENERKMKNIVFHTIKIAELHIAETICKNYLRYFWFIFIAFFVVFICVIYDCCHVSWEPVGIGRIEEEVVLMENKNRDNSETVKKKYMNFVE